MFDKAAGLGDHDIYGFEDVLLPPLPSGKELVISEDAAFVRNTCIDEDEEDDESAMLWRKIQSFVGDWGEDGDDDADAAAGIGGEVWPAAAAMCSWLANHSNAISDSRVLELGAGTGVCGIYAAGLGAKRVLLADGGSEGLLDLCRSNVNANKRLFGEDSRVDVMPLRWGRGVELDEDFDWVIVSDCTYGHEEFGIDSDVIGSLCQALGGLLRAQKPPRVVLAHEHRSRDRGLPWLCEDLRSWDEGDEHLESLAAAAVVEGLVLSPLWSVRPRCVERGDFRSWTSDLSIAEVTLASPTV
jgi:predicted nicotinamide N-methyase